MNKSSTKKLAVASVLAALCIVIMLLGSVITLLDLSCAAAASLIIIFAVIELGGIYPWLIWAVASLLSLMLLPDKFGALVFFAFAGYYPMLKRYFERLPTVLEWAVKLTVFNILLSVIIACSLFLLELPETEIGFSVMVYAVCNVAFVVFDIALTRLITFYIYKLKDRFKFIK